MVKSIEKLRNEENKLKEKLKDIQNQIKSKENSEVFSSLKEGSYYELRESLGASIRFFKFSSSTCYKKDNSYWISNVIINRFTMLTCEKAYRNLYILSEDDFNKLEIEEITKEKYEKELEEFKKSLENL